MNDNKRNLKGSPSRDAFKLAHKSLCRHFYATDIDFCLVEKSPPGIAAYFDYKRPSDSVTFSEVLAYNKLSLIAPVFIISSANPETGPFDVHIYFGGDPKPEPPNVWMPYVCTCDDWAAFQQFEQIIRDQYKRRKV